jgi:hypothetical protein
MKSTKTVMVKWLKNPLSTIVCFGVNPQTLRENMPTNETLCLLKGRLRNALGTKTMAQNDMPQKLLQKTSTFANPHPLAKIISPQMMQQAFLMMLTMTCPSSGFFILKTYL